jgi:hypothetical protein
VRTAKVPVFVVRHSPRWQPNDSWRSKRKRRRSARFHAPLAPESYLCAPHVNEGPRQLADSTGQRSACHAPPTHRRPARERVTTHRRWTSYAAGASCACLQRNQMLDSLVLELLLGLCRGPGRHAFGRRRRRRRRVTFHRNLFRHRLTKLLQILRTTILAPNRLRHAGDLLSAIPSRYACCGW